MAAWMVPVFAGVPLALLVMVYEALRLASAGL
jgi:hypothetical protein